MVGLVISYDSLDLIILIIHGHDMVICLTPLSDACCALAFGFALFYLTYSVAFAAYDLSLTIFHYLMP